MCTMTQWFETLWREFDVAREIRDPWLWFGFGAQGLFFARFIWQWIVSEKRGHSTIPIAFWYLSLAGGVATFIYAWHNERWFSWPGRSRPAHLRSQSDAHLQPSQAPFPGWFASAKLRSEVSGENDAESGF